jgi:outer membrane biosynthesis protein TonB
MNLDALIKAERNAPAEATPRESREVWSSIERSVVGAPLLAPLGVGKVSVLSKFSGVGAALSTTVGKVALATAIVAGGTAGALAIPAPPSEAPPKTKKKAPAKRAQKPASAPKPAPPPKSASMVPAPAPQAPADDEVPIQRPKSLTPVQPKDAAPAPAPAEPQKPKAEPEPEPVDHGLLLVQRAERALEKGKVDTALAFLRRHRKLYPKSPLVERREALFVQSLCVGDRTLKAKARWEFNRSWPASRYRAHLREVCLGSEPQQD